MDGLSETALYDSIVWNVYLHRWLSCELFLKDLVVLVKHTAYPFHAWTVITLHGLGGNDWVQVKEDDNERRMPW
jgi:hypothetical protein